MGRTVLGVGVIGAGVIIKRHAIAYRCLPEIVRPVAVADVDINRANAAKREYGFEHAFSDYRDLLRRDDIDAVSICTPANLHSEMVVQALDAGKNLLCEKPMARTLEEADREIEAAARRPDLKASCVFQYRSDPAHQRVRQMIRNNSLGKLVMATLRLRAKRTAGYYASAPGRGSRRIDGGGVLVNQAIHQLDALISFMGNPVEASAVMNTFLLPTEGEDTLVGWVKFENGAFAVIDVTVCAHDEWFTLEVLGENAQTTVRGTTERQDCTWTVDSKSSAVKRALRMSSVREFPDVPTQPLWRERADKVACKLRGRKYLPPRFWGHTPHVLEFLNTIGTSSEAPISPVEARRSLELATALYASAMTGEVVRFPILRGHPFYGGVPGDGEQVTARTVNRVHSSVGVA